MSNPLNIDFEVPYPLIYHYYVSGIIAFSLNLLVIYLILKHGGKMDSFRFYLLAFQIACILSDINITILSQPVGLFPICAGYFNGVLSKVFGLTTHVLMTIFTLLLSGNIEVLSICFLRKHQAIMRLKTMSNSSYYFLIYILCISYSVSIATAYYSSDVSKDEQFQKLHEYYPEYVQNFKNLREFHYGILNWKMVTFFVFVIFGTAKTTVLVSVLVLRMYRTLKEKQSSISKKTFSRHKTALRSLIMRFLTTPLSFLPSFFTLLTALFPSEYSQRISWFALYVVTCHSSVNSIVVILTFPEFRKALAFWRRDERKISVFVGNVKLSVRD